MEKTWTIKMYQHRPRNMQALSNTNHRVKVSGTVLIIWKPLKTRTHPLPVMWKNLLCHFQGKNSVQEQQSQLFSQMVSAEYAYLQIFNVNIYKISNPRDLAQYPHKITHFLRIWNYLSNKSEVAKSIFIDEDRTRWFSTYAQFFKKLTLLASWYTHVRVRIKR